MKNLNEKMGSTLLVVASFLGCLAVDSGNLYADSENKAEKIEQTIEDTAKILQTLAQHEIDALALLGQAVDHVNNQAIKDHLIDLKTTCEKNISTLADLIQRYEGQAPAHTKDFKGYFMQGFQAMRGWPSDQGLMRALHSNLQLLIGSYEDALKKVLPDDVKEPVSQIYEKAMERLKYLQSQI